MNVAGVVFCCPASVTLAPEGLLSTFTVIFCASSLAWASAFAFCAAWSAASAACACCCAASACAARICAGRDTRIYCANQMMNPNTSALMIVMGIRLPFGTGLRSPPLGKSLRCGPAAARRPAGCSSGTRIGPSAPPFGSEPLALRPEPPGINLPARLIFLSETKRACREAAS